MTVLAFCYHEVIPSKAPLVSRKSTHFVISFFRFKPDKAKKLPHCFVKLSSSMDDIAIAFLDKESMKPDKSGTHSVGIRLWPRARYVDATTPRVYDGSLRPRIIVCNIRIGVRERIPLRAHFY